MINDEVTTDVKVVRAEDILNDEKSDVDSNTETSNPMPKKNKKEKSFEQQIPKGKPKSGRTWKEERKRFSSIVKTRGTRMSLDKRQKLKEDLKRVKELSRAIKEEKRAQKEAKKERRRANLKRAEENQRKSEIVQVITNTAKLKKIKKKNLRTIQKRDTVNL
ncbi:coiled-coil domain-containing protein 86 [Ceratina calcarata]|uniref:Coiled-coil domain-containing protein 86 n=1 Tax=Ceratina calcarata TaxID=156304 RepID=A0AAJ7IZB0_9HYME|nr:coiled-coil domain-containing protein 86 [Ceratina calcarata]XP_017880181.1 coiled-coil domain-containing protein 86 [Ceratina calcarata]